MRIKIWGVRGSLPTPLKPIEIERRIARVLRRFVEAGHADANAIDPFLASLTPSDFGGFGGNTPAIEVSSETSHLVIDGGSGIRDLGAELMKGPCGQGKGRVDLLMTHFHWDHLVGLPFFAPMYVPGNEIHFHAVQEDLPEAIGTIFRRPYFPVDFDQLRSSIRFHRLEPRKPVAFGDLTATPYQLDHPDPCWGYRIEHAGKAYSHCVDSETTRFSREELGEDLPLYQNTDLLLFDGQYSLLESMKKETWGHGSAMLGIDLAMRERIPRVLILHHDPAADDTRVESIEDETRRYVEGQLKLERRGGGMPFEVKWEFAREGMVVEL